MKNMKRSHFSGLIKKTGLAVIASTFLIAAPIVQADGHMKPAVVYDIAGKNDKSFNESVFNGVTRFMNDTGIAVTELEPTNAAQVEQSLKKLAQRGYGPIVAVGFGMANATAAAAAAYPDTQFTIIDGYVAAPNVQMVSYKEHEGSFLVGVLAAMASKTGTVGFVGGMDIPLISRFECGYKQGVAHADNDSSISKNNNEAFTVVLANMTGSTPAAFGNPSKGGELTRSQIEAGADVVYAAAGGTGPGVYQAAADMGVLAIGVDDNQNYLQPGTMLTSMYKLVDDAAYESYAAAMNGTWSSDARVLGVAENGVGYAMDEYNADLVSADMIAAAEAARDAIIAGDIVVHDYMSDNSCPL